jgi:alpha-beta hydrolase superfamily lysophospholipase
MISPVNASQINQSDHSTLYLWQSGSQPEKAEIPLLVHGLGGCMAWMEPFVLELLKYYPSVVGLDVSMYGPNESETGHIPSQNALLEHVQQAIETVYTQFNRPVLLIGLSLGGLIVTHALARSTYRLPVAGVVLVSPAFKGSAQSFKFKMYAQVLYRSMVSKSAKPIYIPYDLMSITSDVTQQQMLRQSTGCVTSLTPSSFLELIKLTLSRHQFNNLNYPLYLFRAEEDPICDTAAMDAEWRRWPHKQKQLTLFANVKHDLLLEPVYPQMAAMIGLWASNLF